ncbi:MAG: cold shock domain-containing protein [Pseudomonadota bacterium]
MSIPGKVLVALFAALVAALVSAQLIAGLSVISIFVPCAAASIAAVVLSHRAIPMPGGIAAPSEADTPETAKSARVKKDKKEKKGKKPAAPKAASNGKNNAKSKGNGKLESGTVKWFNGTKGFGFIIRENGEEIFVHHRSIQGDGRRSLKDGADVKFRVVNTDKGPQAEDVESAA